MKGVFIWLIVALFGAFIILFWFQSSIFIQSRVFTPTTTTTNPGEPLNETESEIQVDGSEKISTDEPGIVNPAKIPASQVCIESFAGCQETCAEINSSMTTVQCQTICDEQINDCIREFNAEPS